MDAFEKGESKRMYVFLFFHKWPRNNSDGSLIANIIPHPIDKNN
jgi:hypothetical protein